MEMEINEKPSLSMNIVNAEDGIGMNIKTGGGSGTKDHSKLDNLDYEHSGHIGFQKEINSSNKIASDLIDDTQSNNKFVSTQEKENWNNKSNFSGDYNDLSNKPNLSDYATKNDITVEFNDGSQSYTWTTSQDTFNYIVTNFGGALNQIFEDLDNKQSKSLMIQTINEYSSPISYPSGQAVYDYGNVVVDLSSYQVQDVITDTVLVNKLLDDRCIIKYGNSNYRFARLQDGVIRLYTVMDDFTSGKYIALVNQNGSLLFYETGSTNWEVPTNKVTSISSSSTNDQYPSAKLLYDKIKYTNGYITTESVQELGDAFGQTISDIYTELGTKASSSMVEYKNNKVSSLSSSSTDTQYPNAKATYWLAHGFALNYSISASSSLWSELSGALPYTYKLELNIANIAELYIDNNSIVELLNDNPVLFAQYGFAIQEVNLTTNKIIVYSIGKPTSTISLNFLVKGAYE